MERIVGLTALLLCFIFQSYQSLATTTVPFMNGMQLGTAFDYSKFKVGNSLVEDSIREGAVERRNDMSNMKFKMIKSQKDISDVLDVSGELSVKVMAGLVDVQGKGSYLKSSVTSENTVEVLAQIYYRTVTKTITDDSMIPITDWRNKIHDCKHYIRSITYGGYLIASLKYTAKKDETKEDIQASVEVNVNTKKVNVGIKGQFQSLAESANNVANLGISYTSSALPDETPISLDLILKAISDFPKKIKESKGGIGVPVEVEICELKYLRGNEELNYVISGLVTGKISRFELMFADLESTHDAVDKLVKDPKHARMDEYLEGIYGRFQSKVYEIKRKFHKAIKNLDLSDKPGNLDQLTKAFEAYRDGDKGFVPGKYFRQLKRMQKEDPLPIPLDERLKEREKQVKNQEIKNNVKKSIENLNTEISSFKTYVQVPRTCRDIQGGYPSTNGEHELYLKLPECTESARIYCADMETANPKEYITLPAKGANNFAYHLNKHNGKEELTSFEKIRLNTGDMSVNRANYKFATTNAENGVYHSYGSAGDCRINDCGANTKKGNFKVDISGTDFLLPKSIPYSFHTYPHCAHQVYRKVMSPDRKKWSGYCGGHCGLCWPTKFHLLVEGC